MITIFLICTYFYLRKISKVGDTYMFFLYNRNFDESIVKINPLLKKLVKKLPRTWLFYKLYFVFIKIICATKKKVVVSGEMLPIKDMKRYKKFIDKNVGRPWVTLYKCFKIIAIIIKEDDIEISKEEKISNIKKSLEEKNNKIDDSDIVIYEFNSDDIFDLLKNKYNTNENISPKNILSTLYPIIKDELKSKENLIFSVIFIKKREDIIN